MTNTHALEKPQRIPIADAQADAFFPSGLEYNPPARGMWNIVHMGMLLPEAHQIFACAQGCLRGVILTAAEMRALDRLSWISVSESDMFDGTLESDIIDGVCEILQKLDKRPPVVLLYLSCIHLFAGCDFEMILSELSDRHSDITFVDCYMTPTMRQTVSPVTKMSVQLYGALRPQPLNPKAVGIIGNDRPTDEGSELVKIIRQNGFTLRDITLCQSYEDYCKLADCSINISYLPTAALAGEELQRRFGAKHLPLPVRYDFDGIAENYRTLCGALGVPVPDFSEETAQARQALRNTLDVIGDISIAIDYTAVSRPFELAWLLYEHGFPIKYVIADSAGGEESAFDKLKSNCPNLEIYAAANVNMLDMPDRAHEPVLAIGQKAAYYFATDHFVNIVANGGYYGYAGIQKIAALMTEAYQNPKDRKEVLRHKGFGCESCLL